MISCARARKSSAPLLDGLYLKRFCWAIWAFTMSTFTRMTVRKSLSGKWLFRVSVGLLRKRAATVVLAGQHAEKFEFRVEAPLHVPDLLEQLLEPQEREEPRIDGNHDLAGGHEGVFREDVETRRAVEEDEVIGCLDGLQDILQQVPGLLSYEPLLHVLQGVVGGDDVGPARRDDVIGRLTFLEDQVFEGPLVVFDNEPHGGRGVPLAVEIDKERPFPTGPQGRSETDRRCGLAHSALLVRDGDLPCHGIPPDLFA